MHGFWPIFFLLVVLKIPVLGSMGLVWWAIKSTPEPEGAEKDSGGEPRRFQPEPRGPRNPRRGPRHGGGAVRPLPDCPPGGRTRVARPIPQPALLRAKDGDRSGGTCE